MVISAGTSHKCTANHNHPSPELFEDVCLNGGTELPGTSEHEHDGDGGIFRCACCGEPLFPYASKFDSGTGWPSFWAPVEGDKIGYTKDLKGMLSTEVHCKKCGAHLGHVFGGLTGGGSGDTNYRYCINGVCIKRDHNVTIPLTTDVPWTGDSYMILAIFIAGSVSACCLCAHTWRYARELKGGQVQLSPL